MEKIVYVDIKFWDRFVESFPDYHVLADISKAENWMGMYSFIISSSHLKFNISAHEMLEKAKCDDNLKILWKKSTEGYCNVDFGAEIPDGKQLTTPEELNAVYLLGDNNCQDYERFGVMTITPSDIDKIGYLFKDSGVIIEKGERNNWDFLSKIKNTFNAILIIDPYILTESIDKHGTKRVPFENNIHAILKNILPYKLDLALDITIIFKVFDVDKKDIQDELYAKLDKYIHEEIRPDLNYKMTLYCDRNDYKVWNCDKKTCKKRYGTSEFHNRTILTNNTMIESGAGFALFSEKYKSCHNTPIRITYPYFMKHESEKPESYLHTIKLANRLHESIINTLLINGQADPEDIYCWGDCRKNRLLEFITVRYNNLLLSDKIIRAKD